MQSPAALAATTELQSSEAARAAVRDVLFMSPQKTNKGQTGATGQGRAKATFDGGQFYLSGNRRPGLRDITATNIARSQ